MKSFSPEELFVFPSTASSQKPARLTALGENKTLPLKGPNKPFESQKAGKILSDFIANKIFMQNISAALMKTEFRFVVVWPAIVHASEIYFDFSTRVESVFSGQFRWKHTASVYLMTTKKCSPLSEQWLRGQLSICHHVLPRFVANMDVFHFFSGGD